LIWYIESGLRRRIIKDLAINGDLFGIKLLRNGSGEPLPQKYLDKVSTFLGYVRTSRNKQKWPPEPATTLSGCPIPFEIDSYHRMPVRRPFLMWYEFCICHVLLI
jgi:hypothetical protein